MARKKTSKKRYGKFSAKEEEAKSKKKSKAKRGAKKTTKKRKSGKRAKAKKTGVKKRKSRKSKKAKATTAPRKTKKRKKAKAKKSKARKTTKKRKSSKSKKAKASKAPRKTTKKRKKAKAKKSKARNGGGKRRSSGKTNIVRVPGKTEIVRVPGKTEVIRIPVRVAAEAGTRKKKTKKRKGGRRAGTTTVVYTSGVMENPINGYEWIAILFTGVAGFGTMDIVDRLIATHKLVPSANPNAPAGTWGDQPPTTGDYPGLFNATAILAPMNKWRYLAGVLITGTPIIIAQLPVMSNHPVGRSAFQLFGIGAGLRFAGKAFQDFMAWALKKTKFGQQVYDAEMRAAAAKNTKGDLNSPDFPWLPTTGLGATEDQTPPAGAGAPNGYTGAPAGSGVAGAPCGSCINCRTGVGNCACPCQAGGSKPSSSSANPPSSGTPSNPPSSGTPSAPSAPPASQSPCPPGMARNADGVCVQVISKQPAGPAAMSALAGVPRRRGIGTGAPQDPGPGRRFGLYRKSLPKEAA